MQKNELPLKPHQKAAITAKWANTMMKWAITYASKGKPWKIVSFEGPRGSESRGIVDLIAIRRNHKSQRPPLKSGDLFEIILIQVKGGGAAKPSASDIKRLINVGKYYHVKAILLAEWKKKELRNFYKLEKSRWVLKEAKSIFS